jgi:FlaA1/EpsC-like NDP-sugar epimerase
MYSVPSIIGCVNRNRFFVKVKNFQIMDLLGGNSIVIDKKSISSQLKGKTVLITGAAGDIGCEIVCACFCPEKIIMVDQAETPLHHLILQVEKAVTSSQIHAVIAIRNYARMDALFQSTICRLSRSGLSPCFFDGRKPSSSGIYKCNGNKNVADLALRHQVESL